MSGLLCVLGGVLSTLRDRSQQRLAVSVRVVYAKYDFIGGQCVASLDYLRSHDRHESSSGVANVSKAFIMVTDSLAISSNHRVHVNIV